MTVPDRGFGGGGMWSRLVLLREGGLFRASRASDGDEPEVVITQRLDGPPNVYDLQGNKPPLNMVPSRETDYPSTDT